MKKAIAVLAAVLGATLLLAGSALPAQATASPVTGSVTPDSAAVRFPIQGTPTNPNPPLNTFTVTVQGFTVSPGYLAGSMQLEGTPPIDCDIRITAPNPLGVCLRFAPLPSSLLTYVATGTLADVRDIDDPPVYQTGRWVLMNLKSGMGEAFTLAAPVVLTLNPAVLDDSVPEPPVVTPKPPVVKKAVPPKAKAYKNCTALRKIAAYKGGVKRPRAVNKGGKIKLKAYTSAKVYKLNKTMDRDKDGIACER